MVMSLSHFLEGDPVLFDKIKGMDPDIEKHNFQMTLSVGFRDLYSISIA